MSNQFITSRFSGSVTIDAATSISTTTLAIASAGTETSHVFSANLKAFEIKARDNAELKASFVMGDIASGDYVTIPKYTTWASQTQLNLASSTIYFESDKASTTVEIVEYT